MSILRPRQYANSYSDPFPVHLMKCLVLLKYKRHSLILMGWKI
jgi:hypothetical protein